MATRLENVVIATHDQRLLAGFWSTLLGWQVVEYPGEVDVRAPQSQGWLLDLVFDPVTEPKTGKNRVHLDLASSSPADQAAIVRRAIDLGASRIDIGQGDVPWVVLADPEGNEFCVLEPREVYAPAGALAAVVVDAADADSLAPFWAEATGFRAVTRGPGIVGLQAPNGRGPWLEFLSGAPPKTTKNRVHLDIRPVQGGDLETEVRELVECGARRIDIGQNGVPWEVLADPEGNEFCVLAVK
ncbi:MAG: VOC family protein [Kibdelosporangium sp.]